MMWLLTDVRLPVDAAVLLCWLRQKSRMRQLPVHLSRACWQQLHLPFALLPLVQLLVLL